MVRPISVRAIAVSDSRMLLYQIAEIAQLVVCSWDQVKAEAVTQLTNAPYNASGFR